MLIPDYTVFYDGLVKPIPQLPQEAFVIGWSLIYFVMGLAATCVELADFDQNYKQKAFNLYYLQLLVNLLWMPMFFGFRNLFVAMTWTLLLLIMVCLTFRKFLKIKPKCGYMLIIYLLWGLFLSYYMIAIYFLNK